MNTIVENSVGAPQRQVHLLRVTLQLESPLALGSGHATSEFDSPCAVDANGLPYLPGTSLAGALRAWCADLLRQSQAGGVEDWFGFVGVDERDGTGLTSPVRLTAGHIHNARDEVQDGMVNRDDWAQDTILGPLAAALPHREHVRLNHRGVGADTGKFDRSFVPRGHRFTFQLQIAPFPNELARWGDLRGRLLAALAGGELSLGSAQRAGLGRVRAVNAWAACLDLRDPAQRQALVRWRRLNVTPEPSTALTLSVPPAPPEQTNGQIRFVDLALALRACDYWRVGSSANGLHRRDAAAQVPDDAPYREHFVDWTAVPAALKHDWVVPASGIKGALAHRAAFHLNRLEARWVGCVGEFEPLLAVASLFGSAADSTASLAAAAGAGAVWIDDARPHVAPQAVTLNHVRIDRHTGGAYGGALFNEEVLFGGELGVRLRVRPSALSGLCPDAARQQRVVKALRLALADLASSKLAMGAESAGGLGYFVACSPDRTRELLDDFEERILGSLQAIAAATTIHEEVIA